MRKSLILIGAFCFSLASCGGGASDASPSGTPQSKEDVAAEMSKSAKLKPGQYDIAITVAKVEIPGVPASVADQMMQQMGKPQKSSYCLTPEKADQGVKDMLSSINGDCTYSNFKADGATVQGETSCKTPDGSSMTAMINGRMTEETSDLVMKVQMSNKAIPTGKMTILSSTAMKRSGDCQA